jgi:uncharacterized protein with GYD domain
VGQWDLNLDGKWVRDIVTNVEAPSGEAFDVIILTTESLGNVLSERLKAFPMDEAAGIIEKL